MGDEIRVTSFSADSVEGIVSDLQEALAGLAQPKDADDWRLVDSSPLSVFTGPDGKVHAVVVLTKGKSRVWRW